MDEKKDRAPRIILFTNTEFNKTPTSIFNSGIDKNDRYPWGSINCRYPRTEGYSLIFFYSWYVCPCVFVRDARVYDPIPLVLFLTSGSSNLQGTHFTQIVYCSSFSESYPLPPQ